MSNYNKKRERMVKFARIMAILLIASLVVTYSITFFMYLM